MTPERLRVLRLALVAVLFAGLLLAGKLSGADKNLDPERLRAIVLGAGAWGVLVYFAAFSAGQLVQVPGVVFVAAGMLVYGKLFGSGVVWVGCLVSVSVTFAVARTVGGTPFAEIGGPRVKRILARIETHPLVTVIALRVVFMTSPPLNYALALSRVRYRHYLLGSALGLMPMVAAAALLLDVVLRWAR
jgi:uncharacterized membrane protein YdjX (TVP38/TMEM64 family)